MPDQDLLPGLQAMENLHPMLVHLPLGLWPVALGFLLAGTIRGSDAALAAGRWTLHIATLSAVVAAASGLWGWAEMDLDPRIDEIVRQHRNWMLTAGSMSAVASIVALGTRGTLRRGSLLTLVALVAITLGIATIGSDRGGWLVYGKGVGTTIEDVAGEAESGN